MIRFALAALLLTAALLPAAEGAAWQTDFKAAVAQATKEKKALLLDFTGSDWCGWCVKLKKEVFDTKEFAAWAAKNAVLVEVDFPRKKEQSAEVKKQNDALQQQYKIEGFPTIVLLDPTGTKELGRLGYMKGGPQAWTAKADETLKTK